MTSRQGCAVLAACFLILSNGLRAAAQEPADKLLQILASRSGSINAARARVTCYRSPGSERHLILEALRGERAALERRRNLDEVGRVSRMIEDAVENYRAKSGVDVMIRDCRLAIRGTWRRVENFEGRDRQRPNEISVFRDGVWSHWIPQRQGPGVTQRQAHRVVTEEAPSTLGLEVALGLSCPPMARIPVEPTSQALAVTWAEILTPYDAAGARVTDTQRGRLIDMPHRKFKTLRLQVEMGKEPPFPLLTVKVFTEINPGTWLLARHVEWSKHVEFNGIPMAQEMWWANRRQVLVADDGPVDSWKLGQYEDTVYTERLAELEIEPDLPDSVFALPTPEPGSQVYDIVKGETYVIGSAGEILERTAIAARGLETGGAWRWWAGGLGLIVAAFAACWWWRRRP